MKHPKEQGLTRKKLFVWTRNALLASILVHLAFGVIAGFVVAIRTFNKPQATFQGDPPPRPRLEPRKLEMKVKVRNMQKRSSRPQVQPRLSAMSPSDIAIPEIKKMPKNKDQKIKRNISTVGVSGFGQGIGGGLGSGMGGGVSFFGLKGVGQRHLFVVDLSGSMSIKQTDLLKKELSNSLKNLGYGIEYQIICFAGPVWFLGDTIVKKPGKPPSVGIVKTGGRTYHWDMRSWGNISLKGGGNMPRQPWLPATKANIEASRAKVEKWGNSDKLLGTTWVLPLQVALNMNPKPDVIYFMTDGAAPRMEASVKEITDLNKNGVIINTISMVAEPQGQRWLKTLASRNGGAYTKAD